MATRVVSKDGEELWGPDIFGKYSIDKIEAIAKILTEVLKDMTINVKNERGEEDTDDFYTKKETDDNFFRKADFNTVAKSLVESMVRLYLKDIKATDGIATQDDVDKIKLVLNYASRAVFDQTFQDIIDSQEKLSIVPIPSRLLNLETSIKAYDTNIAHLMSVIFDVDSHNAYTSKTLVATKTDLDSVKENIQETKSGIATLQQDVQSLKSNTTVQGLQTLVASLSQRVTTMESRVTTLEGNYNTLNDNYTKLKQTQDSMETRLKMLENK